MQHGDPARVRRRVGRPAVDHEQQVGVGGRAARGRGGATSASPSPGPRSVTRATASRSGGWKVVACATTDRARDRARLAVALDHDPAGGPQVEGQREPGHPGVGREQPLQGVQRGRVGLAGGGRRGLLGSGHCGAVTHGVAHDQRLRVVVAPLPGAPARRRPGRVRGARDGGGGAGRAAGRPPRGAARGRRRGGGGSPGGRRRGAGCAGPVPGRAAPGRTRGCRRRNAPAASRLRWPDPPDWVAIVATSATEPRLPSIGTALVSTPAAPSSASSVGGGSTTIRAGGPLRVWSRDRR